MKFLAGVLLGLLLAGPEEPDVYHVTENNRYRLARQEQQPVQQVEPLLPQVVDGQEWCVIELLGGPLAEWDAYDVLEILDEAWFDYDGPCDMMERREDGGMREVQGSD